MIPPWPQGLNGGHKSQEQRLEGPAGAHLSTLLVLGRVTSAWLVPGRCLCLSWEIRTISSRALIRAFLSWALVKVSYCQGWTHHATVLIYSFYSVPRGHADRAWHFQLTFTYDQKPLVFWKTMVRDKNRKIKQMRKPWDHSKCIIFGARSRGVHFAPWPSCYLPCCRTRWSVVTQYLWGGIVFPICGNMVLWRSYILSVCFWGKQGGFKKTLKTWSIFSCLIHITVITVLFSVGCYMLLPQKSHCCSQSVVQVSVLGKERLRVAHATLIHHDLISLTLPQSIFSTKACLS